MNPQLITKFKQAQDFLTPDQRHLFEDIITISSHLQKDHINDYSFLVAPAAKAYEGFLKDFFLQIRIIDRYNYKSDRFRVGKTLNPSLRYKRFSIFQKLAELDDNGEELAEILWNAWKFGRNEIFHFFPHSYKKIDKTESENRITMILNAIIAAGHFLTVHASDPQIDLL